MNKEEGIIFVDKCIRRKKIRRRRGERMLGRSMGPTCILNATDGDIKMKYFLSNLLKHYPPLAKG